MADSSFDIVSKIDRQEVDNALGQTAREIATRFDFKGTGRHHRVAGRRRRSRSPPPPTTAPRPCSTCSSRS